MTDAIQNKTEQVSGLGASEAKWRMTCRLHLERSGQDSHLKRKLTFKKKSQRKGESGMWIAGREAILAEEISNTKGPRVVWSVSIKETNVAGAESEGEGRGDSTGERMGGGKEQIMEDLRDHCKDLAFTVTEIHSHSEQTVGGRGRKQEDQIQERWWRLTLYRLSGMEALRKGCIFSRKSQGNGVTERGEKNAFKTSRLSTERRGPILKEKTTDMADCGGVKLGVCFWHVKSAISIRLKRWGQMSPETLTHEGLGAKRKNQQRTLWMSHQERTTLGTGVSQKTAKERYKVNCIRCH